MVGNKTMTEFHKNKWPAGYPETISGSGSTVRNTQNIRSSMPGIFSKYNIKSFFDAPCGDRNWIKQVDFTGIDYFGGDIVPEIVEDINMENVSVFDVRTDTPPDVDMWFCRDCLYHLCDDDIVKAIANMRNSNIKYFMITSHTEDNHSNPQNQNIQTGGFRCLILKEHNYFGLPEPVARFADYDKKDLSEEMLLFEL